MGAVTFGLVRIGVYLDQQPVGSGSHRRQSDGGDQIPFSGAVAGVGHDGQVAEPFDHGHCGHIQRKPSEGLKPANSPFAENHLLVAPGHHVFCGQQPLFVRGGQPTLDHDRFPDQANFVEQIVVLHVPGADLQDVCVLGYGLNVSGGHDFGDDWQAGFLFG